MSKTEQKATPPKAAEQKATPPKRWKPSYRFVDYKGRNIVIKLHDPENGYERGEVAMTVNGPVPTSHSKSLRIDKDGYEASSEKEENALLKLANRDTHGSRGGSYLVTWENREMPPEQRKAELSAAEYKKRIEDLQEQVADKATLEEENRSQTAMIENLQKQLAANKGG